MRAHLIGGGPGQAKVMTKLLHDALTDLREKPTIAYVGVANGDDPGFRMMMTRMLSHAHVVPVLLADPESSRAEAVQVLADADAIFLAGGDVDLGMQTLRDRDVDGVIRSEAAAGKRIIGISAGSIMAGRAWVRFPDDEDESRAERFACLGLVPLSFDAHAEEDDWAELRTFVRLSLEIDRPPIGYGLPAGGALVYESTPDAPPRMSAHGANVVRIGLRDGHIGELDPLVATATAS